MRTYLLGIFLLSSAALTANALGGVVAADNLVYDPIPNSGWREDIGYSQTTNGGFANTADAQPFVAGASGRLESITSLIRPWGGGEPLRVAIHEWTADGPGASLGHAEFDESVFPTDYSPPTVLDMSASGVLIEESKTYAVVLTTATPIFGTPRYSLPVLPPTSKSFGLPYWFSRDGVTYAETSISRIRTGSYELPFTITLVPEPAAAAIAVSGLALVMARQRNR